MEGKESDEGSSGGWKEAIMVRLGLYIRFE
jgi:hypothetical protein